MSIDKRRKLPKALIGPISAEHVPSCVGVPGIAGIYRIACGALGRFYIGQTTDVARRWLEHQSKLVQGCHPNSGLQAAYRQFGHKSFSIAILEHLPSRYDEGLYCLAEDRWLNAHVGVTEGVNSLFNVRPAGTNHWLRSTDAGRKADQAAARRSSGQANFHKRNRHHF